MEIKQKVTAVLTQVGRVIRSRLFAAAAMCMAAVVLAVGISVNSHAVTITDGDTSRVVLTMHSDPYKVLASAGVALEQHDEVAVNADTEHIEVQRAMEVQVKADGITTMLYMTSGTVEDALKKAEVTVGPQDTLSVKQDVPVSEGLCVTVDRVAYREYTVTETIDYEVSTRYTFVLNPGRTKVLTAGQEGERTITYRQTIVNGQVTETKTVSEKVTKKAVTKQVLKGSDYGAVYSKAPFSVKLDSKNQPVNYKKKFSGSCTAYATGSRGASGMRLGVGTIAVNPKQIPYGSKLWITSADGKYVYGYAIAADTGGFATRGSAIADLYMGSYTQACHFGRRNMNIYVLE